MWLVWNCLRKPLFVIPFFRDDSLPRARSCLSQICFLSLPTRRRSGGGPFTNLGYCSAIILAYKSFVNTSHNHFRQFLIERRKEKENFFFDDLFWWHERSDCCQVTIAKWSLSSARVSITIYISMTTRKQWCQLSANFKDAQLRLKHVIGR